MNRWLAGRVFWPVTERMRGRDTMRLARRLARTQHWPAERIARLQTDKLRRLLGIAADHCPFHAERLRAAGLDPADPQLAPADLARLPTLSRADIRDNLDALTWRDCPDGVVPYDTGGSTGEPLRFYIDRRRQAADWAARFRARRWWGIVPGDDELLLWGAPVVLTLRERARRWRDALLNQHALSAFDMTPETMDAYIERLRTHRPVVVYGYASSLALLARRALEGNGRDAPLGSDRLRAVFTTGEVLTRADRDVIAGAFGAPVVNEYGSRDGGLLACGCPAGRMHLSQENAIVELLDDAGRPVAPGEVGEVTVTFLEASAMPLIRYRLGDLARACAPEDPCPCGCRLAALAEVRGRVTDQIAVRTGGTVRRMHALALIYVLREAEGVRQFRLHQRSLDALDVEIVTDDRFTPLARQEIEQGLRRRLGPDIAVRIHHRERITPTAAGKHACVVSSVTCAES